MLSLGFPSVNLSCHSISPVLWFSSFSLTFTRNSFSFLFAYSFCPCDTSLLMALSDSAQRLAGVSTRNPVLPFPVTDYKTADDRGRTWFDASRFAVMRYLGGALAVRDSRNDEDRLTGVGACHNRWAHWAGRRDGDSFYVGSYTDSPFVRCCEERNYERRLSSLADRFAGGRPEFPSVDLSFFCFTGPFERVYWFNNLRHWERDVAFERHWRVNRRMPIMVGWHNVQVFAISPARRVEFYVPVPDWWSDWESLRFLFVPTPAVFAYFHSLSFLGVHCLVWCGLWHVRRQLF